MLCSRSNKNSNVFFRGGRNKESKKRPLYIGATSPCSFPPHTPTESVWAYYCSRPVLWPAVKVRKCRGTEQPFFFFPLSFCACQRLLGPFVFVLLPSSPSISHAKPRESLQRWLEKIKSDPVIKVILIGSSLIPRPPMKN